MGYSVPIICEETRVPEVDLPVRVFSSDAGPAKGCQTFILFDFDMLVINMQEVVLSNSSCSFLQI